METATKMKLELKHLAPYLPYGLNVQYEGIINGKEMGEYNKQYNKDHDDDLLGVVYDSTYDPPKPIRGFKTGYLKIVEFWKEWTVYRIGNKKQGLQTHHNTDKFKPILRPLSDLTKEENIDVWNYVLNDDTYDLSTLCEHKGNVAHQLIYQVFDALVQKHFDVFGLIEKELAIDINKL